MSLIYEPKGKAREYSPLAINIYMGCSHQCKYCYAPSCMRKSQEQYFIKPKPRENIAEKLEKELTKNGTPDKQVLLSFIGDVYCKTEDNNKATRECLEVLYKHNVQTAILTKGGERCLKDIDIFKKFGGKIKIGTTLTFDNAKDSYEWEKGAALPEERMEVLKEIHRQGIETFASFEPVIKPEQSLNLMKKGLDFIDSYKIGKLNNYHGIDKSINWEEFLRKTVDMLRANEKEFYIKKDLRNAANKVKLNRSETETE